MGSTGNSIASAQRFIERNLGEDLNGRTIAEEVFSSYYHFQHKFKDFTGEPVWQYIKRLRLEKACFLLIYTDLPVSEIAILIGFETTAAFSKAFSRRKNLSPQKYRIKFQSRRFTNNILQLDWNAIRQIRYPSQKILSFRSEGIQQFPQGYFKWLQFKEGDKKNEITLIGRSPDQPGITSSTKLRWDTAIAANHLPENIWIENKDLFFEDYLSAGNYLVLPFTGFGTPLTQDLPGILSLLHQQGLQWNPSGHFFQVLKKHLQQNQCITDLYIPIV